MICIPKALLFHTVLYLFQIEGWANITQFSERGICAIGHIFFVPQININRSELSSSSGMELQAIQHLKSFLFRDELLLPKSYKEMGVSLGQWYILVNRLRMTLDYSAKFQSKIKIIIYNTQCWGGNGLLFFTVRKLQCISVTICT